MIFSAGGHLGTPWHAGVVAALAEHTGWEANEADLLVGTSAGAFTTTALRSGISATDNEARHVGRPLSPQGQAILDRIVTPYEEPVVERSLVPSAPRMALNAVLPPWKADPLRLAYGLLPNGTRSGDAFATRVDESLPNGWPDAPTWIVAVRTNDGKRVVFGRDDVRGTPGQATQASAAVPAVYTPVNIGSRTYVDGALHSATNADLVSRLGFDLVIVSSLMTATETSWRDDPTRAWYANKLADEVAAIQSNGTPVVVIEPDANQLDQLSRRDPIEACHAGRSATERVLGTAAGDLLRTRLASTMPDFA